MTFSSLLLSLALGASSRAETTVIKFATLAPEGTTWMKEMTEFDKELQQKTSGRVKFKFYAGGVSGGEKDVVRKMRIGQLHSAGITGFGLGEIAPSVRVLDGAFLFRDAAEADHVLARFDKELSAALEKGGFVNLGWTEVGFVHLFTKVPVQTPEDLRKVKMWVWDGDPVAEAMFKAFDVHPIPLDVPDVLPSLHTGLVDAVYASPATAIAVQWFTKEKYIYPAPIADASGAVVVSKKLVDGLSSEDRAALLELGRKHMGRLNRLGREENRQALATLQKQGLTLLPAPSAETLERYEEIGRKARRMLAGRLYPSDLLDRVEKAIAEARAGKAGSGVKGAGKGPDGKPSKG